MESLSKIAHFKHTKRLHIERPCQYKVVRNSNKNNNEKSIYLFKNSAQLEKCWGHNFSLASLKIRKNSRDKDGFLRAGERPSSEAVRAWTRGSLTVFAAHVVDRIASYTFYGYLKGEFGEGIRNSDLCERGTSKFWCVEAQVHSNFTS